MSGVPEMTTSEFEKLQATVLRLCGVRVPSGRQAVVQSRLWRVMRVRDIADFSSYLELITSEDATDAITEMLHVLTTDQYGFFAHPSHFAFLRNRILPEWKAGSESEDFDKLRGWSVGCSSGEEPYSLAIELLEDLDDEWLPFVQILATDVSTQVLKAAQEGIYPLSMLTHLPESVQRAYFQKGVNKVKMAARIHGNLAELITFKRFHLLSDFSFKTPFNFIFCRNIISYFPPTHQQEIIEKLFHAITPGGYLFLGEKEHLSKLSHGFTELGDSIYQKPGS